MIKKTVFIAALTLCSVALWAQNPVGFGVKGGISLQNMSLTEAYAGPYALSAESNMGYSAGVMLRVRLMKKLFLQPEITYSFNSYDLSAVSNTSSSTSTVKINTIEVPILLEKRIIPFLRLQIGPVFNLWTQSTVADLRSEVASQVPPSHMVVYNRPSVGYMVGLGIDLGRKLSVTGRYNGEFSKPVQAITIGDHTAEVKSRVHTWIFSVGLSL